ncbi:hypothetical protein RHMOL_Rhmol04G0361800 [Rhododendron molle]|uniref:Uncharacterized protein n=1 Tax=Rhododendron molle TaxID=49168 RepID=A0ACC0P7V7_RHOML|nr:hypothetical protein RHMOL_Rhmol04G0361800 [Rhododendron molle]
MKRSHSQILKRSHSQILSGIEPTKLPEEDDKHLNVIISYAKGAYSHSLHRIRVVDLKSCCSRRKLNNLPKPILELPRSYFPTSMGFFFVGSKIYMVGGGEITFELKDLASRRCYVLDTCDDPIYRIRDVPPMNCEKLRPIVLGPLKGNFISLTEPLAHVISRNSTLKPSLGLFFRPLPHLPILVLAFSFDWDKGFRELGVMLPSWLEKYEATRIMVPMGKNTLIIAHAGFPEKTTKYCYLTLDMCEFTCKSSGEPRHPMGKNTLIIAHAGFPEKTTKYCYLTLDMCEFTCKSSGEPRHPKVESRRYSTKYTMTDGSFEHLGLSACLVTKVSLISCAFVWTLELLTREYN